MELHVSFADVRNDKLRCLKKPKNCINLTQKMPILVCKISSGTNCSNVENQKVRSQLEADTTFADKQLQETQGLFKHKFDACIYGRHYDMLTEDSDFVKTTFIRQLHELDITGGIFLVLAISSLTVTTQCLCKCLENIFQTCNS